MSMKTKRIVNAILFAVVAVAAIAGSIITWRPVTGGQVVVAVATYGMICFAIGYAIDTEIVENEK